jgi:CRISPR-associated endonuclease/helicase Cas3
LDEVQLMSSSLTTSLQLQAWRKRPEQREGGPREADRLAACPLPTHSWWMSATAAEHWFKKSIAMRDHIAAIWEDRVRVDSHEAQTLLTIPKTLERCSVTLTAASSDGGDAASLSDARVLAAHLADPKNRKGKRGADDIDETENVLTLVICNTVDRAIGVYNALKELKSNALQQQLFDDDHLLLLHSRFRAHERAPWPDKLTAFERGEGSNSGPRIIVATQVIEAGVDISASVLYTELCPLASLIQRLGRCARRAGESGKAFWIDFHAFEVDVEELSDDHVASARPYDPEEIGAARKALKEAERSPREASAAVNTVASEPSRA